MKTFICPDSRVEQHPAHDSPTEPELMSIRRDLLLRTALLRQPGVPPLPPLRAVMQPDVPLPARRTTKPASRRRRLRVVEGQGTAH